jgi:O-antigen/teichoic acid export membrane protein
LRDRARDTLARMPLPPGAVAVGIGLAFQGITSYGYLVIASRALGPERYSPLSALWALIFVAAPGLFLPLEQEVGRALSARRAIGVGGRPVLRRAGAVGALIALGVLIVALAAYGPLTDRLFDGQTLLLVGFTASVIAYVTYFLGRGALAGNGRFRAYASVLVVEGLLRVAVCAALAIVGVRSAGAYGLVIGLPCVFAIGAVLTRERGLAAPGPPAAWSEISSALALLLVGSVLAQALINVGPLAVKVLATDDAGAAGRFLDGLIIARIPLFFFQAIQAALLPRLAAQAAAGHFMQFRHGMLRLLAFLMLIAAAATVTMFAVGPPVVRVLFGAGFDLGRVDLAILAAGSGLMMSALALAQGCIALRGYGRTALGWTVGMLMVGVVLAVSHGVILRAELAFLFGVVTATGALGVGLAHRLGHVEANGLA